MIFNETELDGAYIIELEPIEDERGFFARSFCLNEFKDRNIEFSIVQSNVSYNRNKHTLRGMHYQIKPHQEDKLVRCTKGAIYDVVIDMRPQSSTYMKWIGVELTQQNHRMLYVPKGFAHGFITLEDDAEISYQVSEFYNPESERGVRWDDPAFNITWPVTPKIISEKDRSWSNFKKTTHSELARL